MSTLAVVTAIISGRDTLKRQRRLQDADLIAFLDVEDSCPGSWTVRAACATSQDPVRNARNHKVLLHHWLPEAEYSLWIDGNVTLTCEGRLGMLAERYLRDADLAVFRHRVRSCVYEEAAACIAQKKDDPTLIERQIERYRADGYPPLNGLAETAVVFRRHSQRIARFCETRETRSPEARVETSCRLTTWHGRPGCAMRISLVRSPITLCVGGASTMGDHPREVGSTRDRIALIGFRGPAASTGQAPQHFITS